MKRNKIISFGYNQLKTHTQAYRAGYTYQMIHSELDAVLKFPYKDVHKYDFYNTRINRNGKLDIAKPCKYCQDMLIKLGVKKVIYTPNLEEFYL